MIAAVQKMATPGVMGRKLYTDGTSVKYGLANLAAFLAQTLSPPPRANRAPSARSPPPELPPAPAPPESAPPPPPLSIRTARKLLDAMRARGVAALVTRAEGAQQVATRRLAALKLHEFYCLWA